ncbi:MAG: transposase [Verrucomicrobiota bacterium]
MARQIRVEFKGAFYHVMARGNHKNPIFSAPNGADEKLFINTLADTCERSGFRVWAWILMKNHYHLMLETPQGNLVEGMSWLQNTYTRRFNVRHREWGRLFGDRYKAVLIQNDRDQNPGGSAGYLSTVIDYVHLNPARAGLINSKKNESLLDYPWSSAAKAYALSPGKRPDWMAVDDGLALFDLPDKVSGRRKFISRLDDRIASEEAEKCGLPEIEGQSLQSTLRRGWYWGKEEFRESLLNRLEQREQKTPTSRNYTGGSQALDHSIQMAEKIISEGVDYFKLKSTSEETFKQLAKGSVERIAVAWAIYKKTSVSQKWIAKRLGISNAANVSQQVRRFNKSPNEHPLPEVQKWITLHSF